ncbi:MAG TPA: hypothetical protein VK335_19410 [Bryobacteraceae bacterium]|nr:hypothetical protein [Bryobacteraceae bacterium]
MSKLAELRAKTDQDLVHLIGNALELGFQCASAAMSTPGTLRAKAEDLYANALMLLPKIENVGERRKLGDKAARIRELLDRSTVAQVASCSAC